MTESDRELLELAAKSAGIGAHPMNSDRFASDCKKETYRDMGCSFEIPAFWNPLSDDGDALRLAVRLSIHIRLWIYACEAEDNDGRSTGMIHASDCGGDVGAATRRAIVRAAAAIGEAMQ